MLAKELGVVFALGCRTQTLVRHVVTQLLGHHQSGRVGSHGTGRISPPEGVGRGIVEQPPQLRILRLNQVRCEEPSSPTRNIVLLNHGSLLDARARDSVFCRSSTGTPQLAPVFHPSLGQSPTATGRQHFFADRAALRGTREQ